jgi:hypothetical protein
MAIRGAHGFDEQLFHLADWDLWIRLAQSHTSVACPETLVAWLYHGESLTVSDRDFTSEFTRIVNKYPEMKATQRAVEIAGFRWRAAAHRRAGRRIPAAREYWRSARQYLSVGDLARGIGALAGEGVMDRMSGRLAWGLTVPEWVTRFR